MKTITLEFEDIDWQVLEDGIRDPVAWIQNAADVKMGKVKSRILTREQARLIADPAVETIPATIEGILQSYFSQDGYLKAADRPLPRPDEPLA